MVLRLPGIRVGRKTFLYLVVGGWTLLIFYTISNNFPESRQEHELRISYRREKLHYINENNLLAHHSKQENYTTIIENRLKLYRKTCEGKWSNEFVQNQHSYVFYDDSVKLGYCFVAKIGCTFWFRILSFLTRPNDMRRLAIRSPFEIDRSKLHTGELGPPKWQFLWDYHKVNKPHTIKFLFSRNPFERLWSVYLDKYYLIDYWVTHPIAKTYCGINITFQNFLEHAVKSHDHHLVPVVEACQPCSFKPSFIGKMETFSQDSKHLLKVTDYSFVASNFSHKTYVETELKSLIIYQFKAFNHYPVFTKGECMSAKQLCERMWTTFQMNGLIREDIHFPDYLTDYSYPAIMDVFLDSVKVFPVSKEESKRQRRKALVDAYSSVTRGSILAIQKRYEDDFKMFGYDLNPPGKER